MRTHRLDSTIFPLVFDKLSAKNVDLSAVLMGRECTSFDFQVSKNKGMNDSSYQPEEKYTVYIATTDVANMSVAESERGSIKKLIEQLPEHP